MDVTTRESLHRVAEHVMAKTQYAAIGKVGLRPAPGGFKTQDLGDGRYMLVCDGALDDTHRSTPRRCNSSACPT